MLYMCMYVCMHIELPSSAAHRIAEVFLTETFLEELGYAMPYRANECIAAVFNL